MDPRKTSDSLEPASKQTAENKISAHCEQQHALLDKVADEEFAYYGDVISRRNISLASHGSSTRVGRGNANIQGQAAVTAAVIATVILRGSLYIAHQSAQFILAEEAEGLYRKLCGVERTDNRPADRFGVTADYQDTRHDRT